MTAYYNEHDVFAAQWLRELIKAGHIAPGDVDERDIQDVKPDELKNYTQCHFFAGIGVWSYALRKAGWPDDRPVWTGSCPCQPFSAAGRGAGVADERHLWPHWFHLITQRRPSVVFGEQVASKDGLGWLDLVQTDLEGAGYANGAVDLCAAGFGAPHIRQRLWFVAERLGDTGGAGSQGHRRSGEKPFSELRERTQRHGSPASAARRVADTDDDQRGRTLSGGDGKATATTPIDGSDVPLTGKLSRANAAVRGLADTDGNRCGARGKTAEAAGYGHPVRAAGGDDRPRQPGPTNGRWRDADWLFCRDGKWRPVEPSTFPLVNGAAARVGRLRGYGNAINAEVAQTFIEAYLE